MQILAKLQCSIHANLSSRLKSLCDIATCCNKLTIKADDTIRLSFKNLSSLPIFWSSYYFDKVWWLRHLQLRLINKNENMLISGLSVRALHLDSMCCTLQEQSLNVVLWHLLSYTSIFLNIAHQSSYCFCSALIKL